MNSIYFVAGASGVGKTAVIPYLKKYLKEDFLIFDFDDVGVPCDADKIWRQENTENWLANLLKQTKPAVLLGQMVLGELLACPSAKHLSKINYCFLDVEDFKRTQRLRDGIPQSMLEWAFWLRTHHRNPRWRQEVIKENAWKGLKFSTWDRLLSWDSRATIEFFDTTSLTLNQLALRISRWIKQEKPVLEEKERPQKLHPAIQHLFNRI